MRILRPLARIWIFFLGAVLVIVAFGLAARLLLPVLAGGAPPTVADVLPANGARDVAPRSTITLRFSQPMNRRAVERALSVQPAADTRSEWRDDGQTLLLTPNTPLDPGLTYTLRLDQSALSSRFRPFAEPFVAQFRTAPAPSVLAALPSGKGAAPSGPIAVVFSRAMVQPAQVNAPQTVPELRFSPPVSGQARWADPSTLLFSPDTPLQLATVYTATLDAALADVSGTPLGEAFRWSFSTPAPALLRHTPADGARDVVPAQPLVVALSQKVNTAAAERALAFEPPISGTLTVAISGTAQTLVFTPTLGWRPGTNYRVSLGAVAPAVGTLPLPASAWSFTAAPPLQLAGRVPGQGQPLAPGQAARLIFSSPVNTATLATGIAIEPPPRDPPRFSVSGAEVRVDAAFAPSTTYTITIRTSITSTSGIPLDRTYSLPFNITSAAPALSVAGVSGRFVYLPAYKPAELLVERTNLAALDLTLYGLDDATFLRAADFSPSDWRAFSPERYNQPQLRAWRVPLPNDQRDAPTVSPLPIALDEAGAPLPPGYYYLRVRSGEGPGADLVLVVSNTLLSLQYSGQQALVWASDANGAPAAGQPLALYQGSALLASGTTDANGLWLVRRSLAPGARAFVLAERDAAGATSGAAVGSDWRLAAPFFPEGAGRFRALLLSDRATYPPTATVQLGGLVREVRDGRVALPTAGTPLELAVQPLGNAIVLTRTSQLLRADGVISAFLPLGNAPPGRYLLRGSVGGNVFVRPITVVEEATSPLDVQLETAESGPFLRVSSPQGVPVAGAQVRWQLDGLPQSTAASGALRAAYPGYTFGDDTLDAPLPLALRGSGASDGEGVLPLPPTVLSSTQRLVLRAEVQEPGAPAFTITRSFAAPSQPLHVGIRLPAALAGAGEQVAVDLVVVEGDAPAEGVPITLAVLRADEANAAPRTLAQTTTGPDGRARLRVQFRNGGPLRLIARAQREAGELVQSALPLWVVAPAAQVGAPQLVPDQSAYMPGDTAQVLASLPASPAIALVTLSAGGVLTGTVTRITDDRPLAVPLDAAQAPALDLAVLAPALLPADGFAQRRLPVGSPPSALNVALATAADSTGTTTITVTVRDDVGRPVAADVLLSLAEDEGAALAPALATLATPPIPGGIVSAHTLVALPRRAEGAVPQGAATPSSREIADPRVPQVAFWRSGLRTDASGRVVVRVPLPPGPARWRVETLAAAGATRFGSASATIAAAQRVEAHIEAPNALVVGDQWPATLALHNSGTETALVTATLRLSGLQLAPTEPLTRTVRIEPGASQRLSWPVITGDAGEAEASFTLDVAGAPEEQLTRRIAVRASGEAATPTTTPQVGATLQHELFDPATGARLDPAKLRAGQLVGVRVSLVVARPLAAAQLVAPLPAGFAFVSTTAEAPFGAATLDSGALTFGLRALGSGIFTQEYLVRATLGGQFTAPAPELVLANGQTIVGRSLRTVVE